MTKATPGKQEGAAAGYSRGLKVGKKSNPFFVKVTLAIRTNTNSGESTVFKELWHLVHRNTDPGKAFLMAQEPEQLAGLWNELRRWMPATTN